MGFFNGVKKTVKPLVNVPRWMSMKSVSASGTYVGRLFKRVFVPQQPERKEDFNDALQRLNINEQDLQQRRKEFQRLLILFLIIWIIVWAYSIYLFVQPYYRAGVIAFVVGLIALTQAFRYHFWLFQIKQKKLGCGLKEWFLTGLLGRK